MKRPVWSGRYFVDRYMAVIDYISDVWYRALCCARRAPRIYINAYVNHGENRCGCSKNWGDDINYYFLREIIESRFRLFNESPIAFRTNELNYLVIGSTISLLTKSSSIVWGAGCIDDRPLPARPAKVLAVRGPLTRRHLLSSGIDCPEIFGDPAMLIPRYYKPDIEKKYRLGLIHHVSEDAFPIKGAKLISMSDYNNWQYVVDQILECDVIASSSLHGLIVAESYGVPAVWTESKQLIGAHFKFHDFFNSLGSHEKFPIVISQFTDVKDLIYAAKSHGGSDFDLSPLIGACPFKLKNQLFN